MVTTFGCSADTLARFGGDEFAILLGSVRSFQEVQMVAGRIQHDLRVAFDLGGGSKVFVGASVGVALSSGGYTRAPDMMRDADLAMYRAKAAGKGRHVVFGQVDATRLGAAHPSAGAQALAPGA